MKADEVRTTETDNAKMEYITLPTTGIYTNMQGEENAQYNAGYSNEYQWPLSNYGQNHDNNSNGHFNGYNGNLSAFPNGDSCCCGYDSKGQNSVETNTNTQNYGQVQYQYEYAAPSNTAQCCNRCSGGMEQNYVDQGTTTEHNYIKSGDQANYFAMPALGDLSMNMNHLNTDYWTSSQHAENYTTDALQSETVYSSDFQPIYGMGNNFNHFPNNQFMDKNMFMNLIQSTSCAAPSTEYSYKYADPAYESVDNPVADGLQMQGYPISNANYMQMCSS